MDVGTARLHPVDGGVHDHLVLPAALRQGAAAETNAPLSFAVIGGMISSTLFTLVVVPSLYSLVDDAVSRWQTADAPNGTSTRRVVKPQSSCFAPTSAIMIAAMINR